MVVMQLSIFSTERWHLLLLWGFSIEAGHACTDLVLSNMPHSSTI